MNENNSFAEIAAAIQGAQRIGIACHVRPDGDAIGSILGLALSLQLAGKTVFPLSEDGVPGNLAFLPESKTVIKSPVEPISLDVAIALDTATKERLGERTLLSFGTAPLLINMDHHGTNPRYGHLNFINTKSSATAEIVYEFISNQKLPINDAVRQNLYVGINTDTGSFQYNSTTPRTHRIVAEMMEAGLDTATLCQNIYDTQPARRLLLLRALLNEMKFSADGRIASWALTLATLHAAKAEAGDTENLIDVLRSTEGVIAAVIFEEVPDGKIRISSRSKDTRLDVSAVCAEFGGGGHHMAAGARMRGTIQDVEQKFLQTLTNEIKRIP